jgi:predicted NUDIX family NTP pyrophosphohydrolase
MVAISAGVLLYRFRDDALEVLLIHPGGPYWRNRDAGAWMIPKGAIEAGETAEGAALREFAEEVGTKLDRKPFKLCTVRQAGGKIVEAFALEGDLDAAAATSIDFELEWPPKSGRMKRFPETDAARWMGLDEARRLILPSQRPILDALDQRLR